MDQSGVKILFSFHSDLLDQWTTETMWANIVDETKGWYQLDSIPFYVKGVAWNDVIRAEYSEEQESLQFLEVVKPSGHSTIQVIVIGNIPDKEPFRLALREKRCDSEGLNEKMFVVDIPADQDYVPIKQMLDQWETDGLVYYAESCLSSGHYYD